MINMKWFSFSKDILPEVLLSSNRPELSGGVRVSRPEHNTNAITLGYYDEDHSANYAPPNIIIIPDVKPAEFMSWLRTYAPDTSPLSQFARVIKLKELNTYNTDITTKLIHKEHLIRWPSVILGEILALGESEISIDTLPLSRSQATYSHTIARSMICHDEYAHKELCIERLKIAENDKKFVSRLITIQDLKSVWEKIKTPWDNKDKITNITKIYTKDSLNKDLFNSDTALFDTSIYNELTSDSIESRVLAYRKIVAHELQQDYDYQSRNNSAAKIALAAFLVGRSTSHIFLLKNIAKKLPSVYVWFGLLAGIAGPQYWEVDWARATKGIEKNLWTKLDWSEPNQSDLSWTEYDWLSTTFKNNSPFLEMPKQLPKVLSIEIIPGAACQFRLSVDTPPTVNNSTISKSELQELYILRSFFSDLYSIAENTKKQLSNNYPSSMNITESKPMPKTYSKKVRKQTGAL